MDDTFGEIKNHDWTVSRLLIAQKIGEIEKVMSEIVDKLEIIGDNLNEVKTDVKVINTKVFIIAAAAAVAVTALCQLIVKYV